MKKLLAVSTLFFGLSAQADFSSTVTLASNYIWRGVSFSSLAGNAAKGAPVIQGTIDYAHSSGFGLGTFIGNVDSYDFDSATTIRDTETDFNGSFIYKISDSMTTGVYAFWYNYLTNPSNNTMEYNAFFSWGSFRLDYSYIPKYFGFESSNNYVRLGFRQNLTEKFGVLAHVGHSTFEDEKKSDIKNYTDHRAGIYVSAAPFTVELAYSNTDRKSFAGVEAKDKAMTVSVIAAF